MDCGAEGPYKRLLQQLTAQFSAVSQQVCVLGVGGRGRPLESLGATCAQHRRIQLATFFGSWAFPVHELVVLNYRAAAGRCMVKHVCAV